VRPLRLTLAPPLPQGLRKFLFSGFRPYITEFGAGSRRLDHRETRDSSGPVSFYEIDNQHARGRQPMSATRGLGGI
jgi:hypothetical protein